MYRHGVMTFLGCSVTFHSGRTTRHTRPCKYNGTPCVASSAHGYLTCFDGNAAEGSSSSDRLRVEHYVVPDAMLTRQRAHIMLGRRDLGPVSTLLFDYIASNGGGGGGSHCFSSVCSMFKVVSDISSFAGEVFDNKVRFIHSELAPSFLCGASLAAIGRLSHASTIAESELLLCTTSSPPCLICGNTRRGADAMVVVRASQHVVAAQCTPARAYSTRLSHTESSVAPSPSQSSGQRKNAARTSRWYVKQVRSNLVTPQDVISAAARVSLDERDKSHKLCPLPSSFEAAPVDTSGRSLSDIFIGCALMAGEMLWDSAALFTALPTYTKVQVLCFYIQNVSTVEEKARWLAGGLSVEKMLQGVATELHQHLDVAALIALLNALDGFYTEATPTQSTLPSVSSRGLDESAMCEVLTVALREKEAIHSKLGKDYVDFQYRVLLMAERCVEDRSRLAALMQSAGLMYEACAYESVASAPPLCEPPGSLLLSDMKGFGSVVGELLLLNDGIDSHALSDVCARMPPLLRDYTLNLVLLYYTRRSREAALSLDKAPFAPPESLAQVMQSHHSSSRGDLPQWSLIQLASHVHFRLGVGDGRTAALLLPACNTREQVGTVMQHACEVGTDVALSAVRILLQIQYQPQAQQQTRGRSIDEAGPDMMYVVLYLSASPYTKQMERLTRGTHGKKREAEYTLVFEAQPRPLPIGNAAWIDLPLSDRAWSLAPRLLREEQRMLREVLGMLAVTHSASHSREDARDSLNTPTKPSGTLASLLCAVPEPAIPRVAHAVPHFSAAMASWWASLLLKSGKISAAVRVLESAAAREVLPEMHVLVELLECSQSAQTTSGRTKKPPNCCAVDDLRVSSTVASMNELARFADAVRCVQNCFPASAPAVFRAFVERAATRVAVSQGAATSAAARTASALQLLSSVSVIGARCLTVRSMGAVAEQAPSSAMRFMFSLMQQKQNGQGIKGGIGLAAPLHVSAIEKLATAAALLNMSVRVEVVSQPSTVGTNGINSDNKSDFGECDNDGCTTQQCMKQTLWWSSHGGCAPPGTRSVIHHLYRQGMTVLWPVAARELSSTRFMSPIGIHMALRLVVFGCGESAAAGGETTDGKDIWEEMMAAVQHAQHRLLTLAEPETAKDCNGDDERQRVGDGGRVRGGSGDQLAVSLACAAEIFVAHGEWRRALQLIPSQLDSLPPLLRLVRLRAMCHDPQLADFSMELVKSSVADLALEGRRRRRRERRRCRVPFCKQKRRDCRRLSGSEAMVSDGDFRELLSLPHGVWRLVESSCVSDSLFCLSS